MSTLSSGLTQGILDQRSLSVGFLQRPQQSVQQLMTGNLKGAGIALYKPDSLTPNERDAWLREHGLDRGPMSSLFRFATNPITIIAAALAMRYPIAKAGKLFYRGAEQAMDAARLAGGSADDIARAAVAGEAEALVGKLPHFKGLVSMQTLFQGSKVPDNFAKLAGHVNDFKTKYTARFGEALSDFRKATGRLPNRKEEMMVSAWLDGLHKRVAGYAGKDGFIEVGGKKIAAVGAVLPGLESKMGTPLLTVAKKFRTTLDEMFKETFAAQPKEVLLAYMRKLKKVGMEDLAIEELTRPADFAKRVDKVSTALRDYFPHHVVRDPSDFKAMVEAVTAIPGTMAARRKSAEDILKVVGKEAHTRLNQMIPSLKELGELSDLVDTRQVKNLKELVKARILESVNESKAISSFTKRKVGSLSLDQLTGNFTRWVSSPKEALALAAIVKSEHPREYSLEGLRTLSNYTHHMAGMFGWTVKGVGKDIDDSMSTLRHLSTEADTELQKLRAKWRLQALEDTYIPMALGRGTFKQAINSHMREQSIMQMGEWVHSDPVKKYLGKQLSGYLGKMLQDSRGPFSFVNLNRKAAGYFYLSTLGMNPASALKNLFQVVLTTGPTLGYRTTAAGMMRAMQKSEKYFQARFGRGMNHDLALRKAFPEYAGAQLASSPLTDETFQLALQNAAEIGEMAPGKMMKMGEKVSRAMMSLFSFSENAVRLSTFEAAMMHAKRGGLDKVARLDFARRAVEQTQFLTGPQNTPYILTDQMPLTRQLMQFPLRYWEFLTKQAPFFGGDPTKGLSGMNLGTLGRAVLGSIAAYEIGEGLDIELGDALMEGALPTMGEPGDVFAPIPLVPPAFQIAGALGFALQGDTEQLMRSGVLMVPGGVGLSRGVGLLGSEAGNTVARGVGRQFADYDNRTPDGRVAVYTPNGSLKGFYTPWQLVRAGMGVRGGDAQKEQELMRLLISQRDQIRDVRRSYLEAIYKNDPREATGIRDSFKKRFGFDLIVTPEHIEAMQRRRTVSRLETLLQTLPPGEAREQMAQIIGMALGQQGEALIGLDPSLLTAPAAARNAGRGGTMSPTASYLQNTSPLDSLDPYSIGKERPLPLGRFGF